MRFIYPEFLFALFALAIPIIIHLFNFRRFKKVYFTNVRFLREIKQDTRSKSKLKHLLILFSRLAALAFLVLAFAQPYFPSSEEVKVHDRRTIGIYIDNSYSMDARGRNGSLLDEARQKAREIAKAYKSTDQFQILTNDFEARHQRLLNQEEFLEELGQIEMSSAVKNIKQVIARQSDAILQKSADGKHDYLSYIISDFQKSITQLQDLKSDSTLKIRFIPVSASGSDNIFIDTVFFNTPFIRMNEPAELTVRLRNTGKNDIENVPVKLSINNEQKAIASNNIPANSYADCKLSFTPSGSGWQSCLISLTDYPVVFDDHYYFNFNIRSGIQILSINDAAGDKFLRSLFESDPYFSYRAVAESQVDYSVFNSQQLIILNELEFISSGLEQEIRNYVARGGTLFIIPSPRADLMSYGSLFSDLQANSFVTLNSLPEKISALESDHPLFKGVFEEGKKLPPNLDLPAVQKYFQLARNTRIPETALLKYQNGSAFLALTNSGKGQVFTLSVPLQDDFSNFHRHALFVPIMLKAALQGSSLIQAPSIIGRDNEFTVHQDTIITKDQVVHLVNEELGFDIIPENKLLANDWILSVRDQVKEAGNYSVVDNQRLVYVQAFNFDRTESDLSTYTVSELEEIVSKSSHPNLSILNEDTTTLSHTLNQLEEGTRLWKIFVILALIFLAIEVLLLRFYKPALQNNR